MVLIRRTVCGLTITARDSACHRLNTGPDFGGEPPGDPTAPRPLATLSTRGSAWHHRPPGYVPRGPASNYLVVCVTTWPTYSVSLSEAATARGPVPGCPGHSPPSYCAHFEPPGLQG